MDDAQLVLGYLAVVAWLTPEGERRWRLVTRMDIGPEGAVGLLHLAMHRLSDDLIYTEADDG